MTDGAADQKSYTKKGGED